MKIIKNSVKTPDGTILISKHRHDYVSHTDKNGKTYSIDGGTEYFHHAGDIEDCENLSLYDDGNHETRRECIYWGRNFDKDLNKLPETEWLLIKDLTTDHIKAIIDKGYVANNPFYQELFIDELNYREYLKNYKEDESN